MEYCTKPLPESVVKAIADKGQELTLVDLMKILTLNGGSPYNGHGYTPLSAMIAVGAGLMTDVAVALLENHASHCQESLDHFDEYLEAMEINTATAAGSWHLSHEDADALNQRLVDWYETKLRIHMPQGLWESLAEILKAKEHGDNLYKGTDKRPHPLAMLMRALGMPEDEIEKIVAQAEAMEAEPKDQEQPQAQAEGEAGAQGGGCCGGGACQGCSCQAHE